MQLHVALLQMKLGCKQEKLVRIKEEESTDAITAVLIAANGVKGVADCDLLAMFCAAIVLPGNTLVIVVEEWNNNSDYSGLLRRANSICDDVEKIIVIPKQGTGPVLYRTDTDGKEEWYYLCEASCSSYTK